MSLPPGLPADAVGYAGHSPSHVYKKNDNAYVELKKGTHVRDLLGVGHCDAQEQCGLLVWLHDQEDLRVHVSICRRTLVGRMRNAQQGLWRVV